MSDGTIVIAIPKKRSATVEISVRWVKPENYAPHIASLKAQGFEIYATMDIDGDKEKEISAWVDQRLIEFQTSQNAVITHGYQL